MNNKDKDTIIFLVDLFPLGANNSFAWETYYRAREFETRKTR